DARQLRPHGGKARKVDAGMGEQLERRAGATVLVDVETVAGRLVGSKPEARQQRAALLQSCTPTGEGHAPLGPYEAQGEPDRCEALVRIIRAQAQTIFGAGGK